MEVSEKEHREEGLILEEVSRRFRQVNQHSACGPVAVPGDVLKHCHYSLAPVFATVPEVARLGSHSPHLEVLKCHSCPLETLPVCPQ